MVPPTRNGNSNMQPAKINPLWLYADYIRVRVRVSVSEPAFRIIFMVSVRISMFLGASFT